MSIKKTYIFAKNKAVLIKLICKDYTVSRKEFELVYNSDLEMYITHYKPSEKELPEYYKSEAYTSHTDSKKS